MNIEHDHSIHSVVHSTTTNKKVVYYSSEQRAKVDDGHCDGTISLRDVYNLSILSNGKPKRDEEWLPSSEYLRVRSHRKSSRNSIFEGIRKR